MHGADLTRTLPIKIVVTSKIAPPKPLHFFNFPRDFLKKFSREFLLVLLQRFPREASAILEILPRNPSRSLSQITTTPPIFSRRLFGLFLLKVSFRHYLRCLTYLLIQKDLQELHQEILRYFWWMSRSIFENSGGFSNNLNFFLAADSFRGIEGSSVNHREPLRMFLL